MVSYEIRIDALQRALNTQVYEYAELIVDKSACLNKKRHNNSNFSNTLFVADVSVHVRVCVCLPILLTTLSKMKFVFFCKEMSKLSLFIVALTQCEMPVTCSVVYVCLSFISTCWKFG